MKSAGLILCPYNYTIDPAIRWQVNLQLDGVLIIINEADNIETPFARPRPSS
jgi:Fanconi anemia group J protein